MLAAVLPVLHPAIVQEFISVPVDAMIYAENLHLELPHALRAYQRREIYLNPQLTRILCTSLQAQMPQASAQAMNTSPHQTIQQQSYTEPRRVVQDRGLLPNLTKREMEVLACLAAGSNYKQISAKLFVSSSTVKTHVNNIFTKLNINDRTQAVLYALKHGIEDIMPEFFEPTTSDSSNNSPVHTTHRAPVQNLRNRVQANNNQVF